MADPITVGTGNIDYCFAEDGNEIPGLCITSFSLSSAEDEKEIKCGGETNFLRHYNRRQTATVQAIVRAGYNCPQKLSFIAFPNDKADQDWQDNFSGNAGDMWLIRNWTYNEERQEGDECTISLQIERWCTLQP